jgi:hypothetical protein
VPYIAESAASVYPCTMNRSNPLFAVVALAVLGLAACQSSPNRVERAPSTHDTSPTVFSGEYDNHEQVWQATQNVPPRVRFTLTPMADANWSAWRIDWNADRKLSVTWMMRQELMADGKLRLTPHRPLVSNAAVDKRFDHKQWLALDACALVGTSISGRFSAALNFAQCATVAPGVGVEAALLPLSIEREGEWLRVRVYADQARAPDARSEARRVRWFSGWAAINGAGAAATSDSSDWHMNRELRIDTEGGSAALVWRDGKPSGYSITLERVTYREGNTPVLKLSVIEDSSGRAIVYSWANPEASRIGLNLGWVQIGLELDSGFAKK